MARLWLMSRRKMGNKNGKGGCCDMFRLCFMIPV